MLLESEHVHPHYMITVDRVNNLDKIEVQVEVNEELFHDEMRRFQDIRNRLKSAIESTLGLSIDLKLVEPRTLARSEGKAQRGYRQKGEVAWTSDNC